MHLQCSTEKRAGERTGENTYLLHRYSSLSIRETWVVLLALYVALGWVHVFCAMSCACQVRNQVLWGCQYRVAG